MIKFCTAIKSYIAFPCLLLMYLSFFPPSLLNVFHYEHIFSEAAACYIATPPDHSSLAVRHHPVPTFSKSPGALASSLRSLAFSSCATASCRRNLYKASEQQRSLSRWTHRDARGARVPDGGRGCCEFGLWRLKLPVPPIMVTSCQAISLEQKFNCRWELFCFQIMQKYINYKNLHGVNSLFQRSFKHLNFLWVFVIWTQGCGLRC